jgi:hypothetical protein
MNQELLENIETYLEGKLPKSELEAIAKAAGVENLEEEIRWVKDVQVATGADGLREQLASILPKEEESKVNKIKPLRVILAVAASIAILVTGYFTLVKNQGTDLYAKYQYEEPGLPVVMGDSDRFSLDDALTYYGEGNYKEAINRLQAIEAGTVGGDTIQYFLGLSYLYDEQPDLAGISFQKVMENQNSVFNDKAEWLDILASLQSKSYQAAKQKIETILVNTKHPFYDEAKSLQKDLENL